MAEGPIITVHAGGTIRDLNRIRGALLNPRPYLVMIARELERVKGIAFEKEQSPEGAKWKSLSARYAAWKTKKFPGQGMLRKSGELWKIIFTGTTDRSAYISTTNLPYAAMHQYGFDGAITIPAHIRAAHSRRAPGGIRRTIQVRAHKVSSFSRHLFMPARPYLGFPLSSEKRVVEDIERDLAAKASGTQP